MKKLTELTDQELLEISNLFIQKIHSDSWKIAEAKDLMKDDYNSFIELPKEEFKESIISYLSVRGFELPKNRFFK